jgi:formylglycine-generating enzyme required for sulfatase activity
MLFLYSHREAKNRDAKLAGRTETENPKQVVAQPADSTPQTIPGTPSLAVASNPPPAPVVIGPKPPHPVATRWTNSLGMIFVPIPGSEAMFCIWITRVQDYQVMADATARPWEKTRFAQGPTHPAVNISWEDAMEFCSWLTRRERGMDWIRSNQLYRLPTDIEWSLAVGLGHEKGKTPKDKDNKTPGMYPWGRQWPPPRGVGNFDPSLNVDDYIYTSPVGAFPPNPFGLYDMAGNAREWCEDLFDPGASRRRVVRGSSWFDTPQKTLESSRRCLTTTERHNDTRPDYFGFRCVLVTGSIRAAIPR